MDASRNLFCGMQRKAHGAQQPRKRALRISAQTNLQVMSEPHIKWRLRHVTGEASRLREQPPVAIPAPDAYAHRVMATGENASTAQRSDALAKWIYGGIL